MAIRLNGMNVETVQLTLAMARSGDLCDLSLHPGTGGQALPAAWVIPPRSSPALASHMPGVP